jgi:hypothetical protein
VWKLNIERCEPCDSIWIGARPISRGEDRLYLRKVITLLYVESMNIDITFKVEMEHVCQHSGMNDAESGERALQREEL